MKAEKRQESIVSLSNNSLQTLPKLPQSTTSLTADNNNLTSLTNLPPHLHYLSLSKNKIAFLGTLDNEGGNLVHLDLSANRLISLEGISACKALQTLLIGNNYVGDDQILHIHALKCLKILDVSHNHLRDKQFGAVLAGLELLEELYNSANDFSEWRMTGNLRNLRKIVLDSNKIRKIEFVTGLPALQKLFVRENNLTSVVGVKNCTGLEEMDLSGNDLNEVPDEFSGLRHLKKLVLRNNSLTTLPKIQSLIYLDASHNTLLSIFNVSENLEEVFVSHNNIAELPRLRKVLHCDFSYNKLTSLAGLETNSRIESINISQNLFQNAGIILNSLKTCKALKTLNMEGVDLPQEAIEAILTVFPAIDTLNNRSFQDFYSVMRRTSPAWDSLSKSKLFPSCRSSLAELDKNVEIKSNELSLFSDIKIGPSLCSSLASLSKRETGQDTEYELLAKELEINNRIKKLEVKTREFGDSLISKAGDTYSQVHLSDSLVSRKEQSLSKRPESLQKYTETASANSKTVTKAENFPRPFTKKQMPEGIKVEDSTISFEISNEVYKEPAKRQNSDRSKKPRCCKYCCKKRKRSINLQTTFKDQKPTKNFMDQATSPMNSLMRISPIPSRSSSKDPKTTDEHKGLDKSPTAYSNRSYCTDVPGSGNRNKSFISEDVENRVLQSKRSSTPLGTYRALPPKGRTGEHLQLISYAYTPPRPILSSESKSPILCNLNAKGTEFYLVSQMFSGEGKTVREVIKTYTYDLQKKLQSGKVESFLQRPDARNSLLFFTGSYNELETICNSPEGFSGLFDLDKSEILVYSDLRDLLKGRNSVLIALSNLQGLQLLKPKVYRITESSQIIPIYLVDFCN